MYEGKGNYWGQGGEELKVVFFMEKKRWQRNGVGGQEISSSEVLLRDLLGLFPALSFQRFPVFFVTGSELRYLLHADRSSRNNKVFYEWEQKNVLLKNCPKRDYLFTAIDDPSRMF